MGWIVFGALFLLVVVYLGTPLFVKRGEEDDSRENIISGFLLTLFLLVGGASLYAMFGNPSVPNTESEADSIELLLAENLSPGEFASRLIKKIENDPDPEVRDFIWLGRSLINAGEIDGGLAAYEQAVSRSNDDPEVIQEFEQAKRFAARTKANAPPLSQEQINQFDNLTSDQQNEMIAGMVQRLSERLAEHPSDIDGWERLLRSRLVLDQKEAGQLEFEMGLNQLERNLAERSQLEALGVSLGYEARE